MLRRFLNLSLLLIFAVPLWSQVDSHRYEVGDLRFQGNTTLNDDQLLSVVRTRTTPWAMWKFVYLKISEKLGEKPEYFDPVMFAADYAQVKRLYEGQGFFQARIDTLLDVQRDAGRVNITFRIEEGPRSFIDTVEYRGLKSLPGDVAEEITSGRLINVKDPFILQNVDGELRRVVSIFANNGYIMAKVDPTQALHYASTNNFSVVYSFNPGNRYQFGSIEIRQDSSAKERIDTTIILRHLDFAPGDYYSESKKVESERNLNRLGIFEATKIDNAVPSIVPTQPSIPILVQVRPRPFQELTPEVGLNDLGNAFNLVLGIGYNNRNFFGGARNFSTRFRFNLQSLGGINVGKLLAKNSLQDPTIIYKLEASTQLVQPFFINNKTTINATLSAILDKRSDYYIPIYRARIGVASQTATYTRGFIDWDLEWIDPISIPTLESLAKAGLYDRQFNSIITFTLQRDKRNDIFSPTEGFLHAMSIEESGLLPSAFGGLFGTHLPYSQYVKATVLGQWYWDPTGRRNLIWAARINAGGTFQYGTSPTPVPITRRFFGGGSGSVRGWRARYLGAVPNPQEGGTAVFESNLEARWNLFRGAGNLWVIELEKFSLVFFYDIGNVWTEPARMRLTELAMAMGFGIRYNTIAGPIRVDFGLQVYDPSSVPGTQWITQRSFFDQTLSSMVFHFGIGHAF